MMKRLDIEKAERSADTRLLKFLACLLPRCQSSVLNTIRLGTVSRYCVADDYFRAKERKEELGVVEVARKVARQPPSDYSAIT
jgi:hypothetical protein